MSVIEIRKIENGYIIKKDEKETYTKTLTKQMREIMDEESESKLGFVK
jgi:hypothetical protein